MNKQSESDIREELRQMGLVAKSPTVDERRELMLRAANAGLPITTIAELSGISREGIYANYKTVTTAATKAREEGRR